MARVRIPPFSIAIIAIILAAIFVPVTITMISAAGDYRMHIRYAFYWEQAGFWGKPLPHFMYQSLLIFLKNLLPGQNYPLAAAIVNVFSYVITGIILYMLFYRFLNGFRSSKRQLTAIILTVALMLVSPVNLLTLNDHNLYFGYINIQIYHNPTVILLKPFALVLFIFVLKIFQSVKTSVPMVLLCAAIAAISTVTKPNYALCILPALALYTVYALYRKKPLDWRLLIVGIVAPIVEVIIWQAFFYRYQSIGGFGIAPLQVMTAYSPAETLIPKLILSILFPLCVLALYFKPALQNLALRLAWLSFIAGCAFTYLFVENREWEAGNFLWGGVVTLFILFVYSVVFLIQQYNSTRKWTPQLVICIAVLLLHLVSGIIFYIPNLTGTWNSWY